MILCNSAGNEGNDAWYYINAPADATDILSVGAVDSTNLLAHFSSRGPSYDERIKPDITAMGRAAGLQHRTGGVTRSNGTSFASPVMAGSVAALWQAFPELPAIDLMYKIRHSAHKSMNPNADYGFGTPNMLYAYHTITRIPVHFSSGEMEVWPNPASEHITIKIPQSGEQMVRIYDLNGRLIFSRQIHLPGEMALPEALNSGIYIIEIRTTEHVYRSRLLKQ